MAHITRIGVSAYGRIGVSAYRRVRCRDFGSRWSKADSLPDSPEARPRSEEGGLGVRAGGTDRSLTPALSNGAYGTHERHLFVKPGTRTVSHMSIHPCYSPGSWLLAPGSWLLGRASGESDKLPLQHGHGLSLQNGSFTLDG
jgi:hypothetical protein